MTPNSIVPWFNPAYDLARPPRLSGGPAALTPATVQQIATFMGTADAA